MLCLPSLLLPSSSPLTYGVNVSFTCHVSSYGTVRHDSAHLVTKLVRSCQRCARSEKTFTNTRRAQLGLQHSPIECAGQLRCGCHMALSVPLAMRSCVCCWLAPCAPRNSGCGSASWLCNGTRSVSGQTSTSEAPRLHDNSRVDEVK